MPAPGDQHRDNAATANPFIPPNTHVTEYTAQEIATLQSRLDKQLGPEYISTRPGNGGGKVHYLAADKVINLANEVFGFNGWSSAIQNVQVDFVDENPQSGRINLGLSTVVRVTLRDGTYHEDIGYGHCENTKGKAAAFEKAKKEGVTDALKRALRGFGNVLGNCLYDKDYLQRITKVKVAPSKWDAENLHRHPDYAPAKKGSIDDDAPRARDTPMVRRNPSAQSMGSFASAEFEDDFGGNFLDETDFSHPDEVHLDDSRIGETVSTVQGSVNGQRQSMPRMHSMPQLASGIAQAPAQAPSNVQQPYRPSVAIQQPPAKMAPAPRMLPPQTPGNVQRAQPTGQADHLKSSNSSTSGASRVDQTDEGSHQLPREPPPGMPEGFVTGRKADLLSQPPESRPSNASLAFNPHLESPSIRRTHGLNPGKSVPITRQQITGNAGNAGNLNPQTVQHPAPPQTGGPAAPNTASTSNNSGVRPTGANFVNPSADPNRRIGMPQTASPGAMANRSAYRPPTAVKRPALADVSNLQHADAAPDAKKPKFDSVSAGDGGQEQQATEAALT